MPNLQFVAKEWLAIGCNQRMVKYLELLGRDMVDSDDFTASIATINNSITSIQTTLSELGESGDLSDDIASLNDNFDDLQAGLTLMFTAIKKLSGRVKELEASIG